MTRKKYDEDFTKIAGKLLVDVRDLVEWGVETGHTTHEQFRLTVAARRELATKLIDNGMSQRDAAKALGVSKSTLHDDVSGNRTENARKPGKRAQPEPDEPVEGDTAVDGEWLLDKLRFLLGHVRSLPKQEVLTMLEKVTKEVQKW